MANRFWVGGSGTWDASTTTNWSATTGGAGGASVPVPLDYAVFDANSGTGVCTVSGTPPTFYYCTQGSNSIVITLTANIKCSIWNHAAGSLVLGSNSVTCSSYFQSNGSVVRSIDFGTTGSINCTSLSSNVFNTTVNTNLSITGTPTVNITGNAASGIVRSITCGGGIAVSFNFVISAGQSGSSIALPAFSKSITFTSTYFGFIGVFLANKTIYGGLTLGANMGALLSSTFYLQFSNNATITTNGISILFPIILDYSAGTINLADNLNLTGTNGTLTITSGVFNTNNFNIACNNITAGSTTKTLNFGTSTITITGGSATTGFVVSSTGTTYNISSSSIVFNTSGTSAFDGGSGATFPSVVMSGSGTLIIGEAAAAQTITTLSNTVQPCTVSLLSTAGTLTVTNFNLAGTAGNLVTFNSSTVGTARTISKASGTVNAPYLSITDSTATGGATWFAVNSTNGGNNTGWLFPTLYSSSVTETLISNDVPDATLSFITALTESLTSADSTTGGTAYVSSITENLVPTDSSSVIQIYNVSIEEAQSVADSYISVLNCVGFIVEGLISGDSSVPNVAFISDIIENLVSADTPTAIKVFNVSISEPQTIVDTANAIAGFISSSIENVVSGESSIVNPVFYQTISETIAVQDSSIAVAAKIIAFVTEAIAMTDTQTAVVSFISSAEERIVTADSSISSKAVFAVIVEPTTIDTAQQGFSWGKIDNTESTQWVLIDNRQ